MLHLVSFCWIEGLYWKFWLPESHTIIDILIKHTENLILYSITTLMHFILSFHWHVQNAQIPCCSQELLRFLSVMYIFLPPFSTNYSFILSHLILLTISWSASQSCCSQNQHTPFNLTVSVIVGFLTLAYISILMHSVLKCTVRNLDDVISTMLYGNGPS